MKLSRDWASFPQQTQNGIEFTLRLGTSHCLQDSPRHSPPETKPVQVDPVSQAKVNLAGHPAPAKVGQPRPDLLLGHTGLNNFWLPPPQFTILLPKIFPRYSTTVYFLLIANHI